MRATLSHQRANKRISLQTFNIHLSDLEEIIIQIKERKWNGKIAYVDGIV